ncbi:hypothetical protein C8Q76DRAFT_687840 [Earliella scabrosa]|nr:hypothetical protein C8Q76DRAFT_687840 [Earliella scabrosa]
MSSTSARAPYGPPALRIFTQTQDPQPDQAQIAAERFRRRYNVRKDNNEQLRLGRQLHPDFCLSKTDRNLAFNEAMGDIEDAVIGGARLADVLFVGFAVRPEWDAGTPLSAAGVEVKVVASRQFQQNPAYSRVLDKLQSIVREELAIPHILHFPDRLLEVTPGPGYAFDQATRRIITNPIRLATPGPAGRADASQTVPGEYAYPESSGLPVASTSNERSRSVVPVSHVGDRGHSGWHTPLSDEPSREVEAECDDVATTGGSTGDEDLPPPYSAQDVTGEEEEEESHYTAPPVESFGFSERVYRHLAETDVTPRQCAEIVVALDYHPNEWDTMFRDIGLSAGNSHTLRSLILEDVSGGWRDMMNAIDPIEDDVVVTVMRSDGSEVTVLAWEEALRDLNLQYD